MIRILMLLLVALPLHAQDVLAPIILTSPAGAPPVTFGVENVTNAKGGGATLTASFTVTDADLILVGIAATWAGPSGATFNGDALTEQAAREYSGFGSFIYTIANPDVGTHDLTVTFPWATDAAICIVGVKATHNSTPVSGASEAEGNDTSPTVNVASAAGALVFDCLCWNIDGALSVTVGANQTQRMQQTQGDYCGGAASTESGATTVTMSWTIGTAREWALTAISVNPE